MRRSLAGPLAILVTTPVLAVLLCASPSAQQPQRFTSSVNMLAVDVRVVDRDGQPILGLLPSDFNVTINRHDRKVVSAELVHFAEMPKPLVNIQPLHTPGMVPDDSRVFAIAVDESSFSSGGIKAAMQSAQRFVANLRPNDMVGLYVFPYERPVLALSHDRQPLQNALARLIGRREDRHGEYHLTPAEIMDITAGDRDALDRVANVECPPSRDPNLLGDVGCPAIIRAEASAAAAYYETDAAQRLLGLGMLIQDLGQLPGRKTVVIVSGGLLNANRSGARPDMQGFLGRLGAQAARSNVGTYVVHINDALQEVFSAARSPSRRAADQARSLMDVEAAYSNGLMRLASETGGAYLSVNGGTGDVAFGRVLRETMAYYLLGVEPTQDDWDGRKLMVDVRTRAKGATVRALREVIAK